jgi:hypothetical protein
VAGIRVDRGVLKTAAIYRGKPGASSEAPGDSAFFSFVSIAKINLYPRFYDPLQGPFLRTFSMQVLTETPNTYETVTRPVVYNVIDQLQLLTPIARDIRVLFPGQVEVSYQIGSTIQSDTAAQNTFPSEGQLTVHIEENYVEDRVLSTAVVQRENHPVFLDRALGVDIRPVYGFSEIVFNFTYRAPSNTLARRFRNDMKMRRSMGRVENLHEVNYSYGIPLQFFPTLGEIYALREAVAGYGDTFKAWFDSHVTNKSAVVVNMAGNEPTIVIREPQIGILGWFDALVTVDEASRSTGQPGTGAMEVNFTYRIQYDKPMACVMRYPIVIHNQLIPLQYRDMDHIYRLTQRNRAPSISRANLDRFTPIYPSDISGIDGVQSPVFDDWRPAQVYPFTSSLITMLIQVDSKDPTNVCSLLSLGDYAIDSDIIDFLYGEIPYLTVYNASVVNIALYENSAMMIDSALVIDDKLNITTSFAMDSRKTYHLRISLVNDLLTLPTQVRDRTRYAGKACLKILATLEGNLPGGALLPTLIDDLIVSKADFLAAGQRINSQKTPLKSNLEYIFLATVGNFTIAAGKRI